MVAKPHEVARMLVILAFYGCFSRVSRVLWDQEVAGSNPVIPTYRTEDTGDFGIWTNNAGEEWAIHPLATGDAAESQVDAINHFSEDGPPSLWGCIRQSVGKSPDLSRRRFYLASHVPRLGIMVQFVDGFRQVFALRFMAGNFPANRS